MLALTRVPSPAIGRCELTYLDRIPIDYEMAARQHTCYAETLRGLGLTVVDLPAIPDLPDATFVEDTAVVLDEIAVMASPCFPRRGETDTVRQVLSKYRKTSEIASCAKLEGGDVIRDRRTLYVGQSTRTDQNGLESLSATLSFYGYTIIPVKVSHCLHLSTAASCLESDTFLVNAGWIVSRDFGQKRLINVPEEEPWAANVLNIAGQVVIPSMFPRTCDLLDKLGYKVCAINVSEFLKAEAGVTCMGLIFDTRLRNQCIHGS